MSLHQEVAMLKNVPMFSGLDPARLKLLSFASERVNFMPGEDFIRQGEIGEDAFLILDGDADILVAHGEMETTIGKADTNHLVGIIALLSQGRRTATVRATSCLTCLRLPKDVFFQLVRDLPDFSLAVMRELAETLERQTTMFREAMILTGEHRRN
jgi:CRP-like cAMP-binding protein